MNIIIDTNVIISALIKNGLIRRLIIHSNHNLLFPEIEFREIYNHKKELIDKSKLSEKELDILILRVFKYIRIIPTEMIIDYREDAEDIINRIDSNDFSFIAAALAFNCPIWSDDKHFKKQKRIKILNTNEILNL